MSSLGIPSGLSAICDSTGKVNLSWTDTPPTCNPSFSAPGGVDVITTSTTKQWTLNNSLGNIVWSITGTGASIDQLGNVTTTGAACGVLTITAIDSCCGTFIQQIRVTNNGFWAGNGPQTQPLTGCTWGSDCAGAICIVISGIYKDDYIGVQCQGPGSLCGNAPCNPGCICTPPNKTIWQYINHYIWSC